MEEKILKSFAIRTGVLLIILVLVSIPIANYQRAGSMVEDEKKSIINKNAILSIEENSGVSGDKERMVGNQNIKIPKPKSAKVQARIKDLYRERGVELTIFPLEEQRYTESLVESQLEGLIKSVKVSYEYNQKSGTYTASIYLILSDIYVPRLYEDDKFFYVNLRNPRDVYDKIIVVDPGHGGNDIGTYSEDMDHYEKDINLEITLFLKELLDKDDIQVYYTRLNDEKVYLNDRLSLANDLNADMFISIHCNGDENTDAHGMEVLYGGREVNGKLSSEALSDFCLKELLLLLPMKNRGLVKGDKIHIIGNSNVPIALIEAGFMSNSGDMNILEKQENKKKVATGIYRGIKKAYRELEKDE